MGGSRLREVVAHGTWRLDCDAKSDVQTENSRACLISRSLYAYEATSIHSVYIVPLTKLPFLVYTVQTLVQSSWSEKSRVYQIWTTRGSQYIDSIQSLNSIQLGQKLIDNSVCYPCAVMPTARCKRIKLIKEQNTGLGTLGSVFNSKSKRFRF